MPPRTGDELLAARPFPLGRPAGLQHPQNAKILGQHLLPGPKPASHALAKNVQRSRIERKQVREFFLDQVGSLRAGSHVDSSVVGFPGDASMGLQMHVLHALRAEFPLVDCIRLGKPLCNVANFTLHVLEDVLPRIVDARPGFVRVELRRSRLHGLLGIEDRRQNFVVDVDQPAGLLGDCLGVGIDGHHALPLEPHHVVQNVGIIRVAVIVVVRCRGERLARHVFPSQDQTHARPSFGGVLANSKHLGMRMWRADHFHVEHVVDGAIHRVVLIAPYESLGERAADFRPARATGDVFVHHGMAPHGVFDGMIASATAQVPFEPKWEVLLVFLAQACARHDHSRRAESTLESLRLQKRLLHGMQRSVGGETFQCRDIPILRAKGRHQAAMHRTPVQPHRASATIPGVTSLPNREPPQFAQAGAQALPCAGS